MEGQTLDLSLLCQERGIPLLVIKEQRIPESIASSISVAGDGRSKSLSRTSLRNVFAGLTRGLDRALEREIAGL